jgi:hypothetical protein
MWYFRFGGQTLKDSRWGPIAGFQAALARQLEAAGLAPVEVDGVFGSGTRKGIARLCTAPAFRHLAVPETDPRFGAITDEIWDALMPSHAPPTVHQRAFVMSLSHEGTDYDRAEWNLDTSDDASTLTWGPYGATVGHGREVQAILRRVRQRDPRVLADAFGTESSTLTRLLDDAGGAADGHALLRPVFDDLSRRTAWVASFKQLGPSAMVREEYEAFALGGNDWLRPTLRRVYQRLRPDAASKATAVDYAFFLDLAMHMSLGEARLAAGAEAIAERERQIGRELRPAERRQIISRTVRPSMQQQDRLGRNVVYYVDGVGEAGLSDDERSAWRARTGRRASDCGLSDDERFIPSLLV